MGYTIDDNYIKALREALPKEQVLTDEPMARHTTFRIGGKADVFVLPASIEELLEVLKLTKRYSVPLTVLGNGSNVLVRDGGIRGAVVSFGKPFSHIGRDAHFGRRGCDARDSFPVRSKPCAFRTRICRRHSRQSRRRCLHERRCL